MVQCVFTLRLPYHRAVEGVRSRVSTSSVFAKAMSSGKRYNIRISCIRELQNGVWMDSRSVHWGAGRVQTFVTRTFERGRTAPLDTTTSNKVVEGDESSLTRLTDDLYQRWCGAGW